MWLYEKRLQYPVNITKTCPKTAQLIISQFGGPDGELAASMRYLSQRYTMPCRQIGGLLTDIGTEELGHLEIICAIVYQLTCNLTPEQAKTAGFDAYYIDHKPALWPHAAGGVPYNASAFQSKGDAVTDLHEDLAAEQKARTTYENLIRIIDDPQDVYKRQGYFELRDSRRSSHCPHDGRRSQILYEERPVCRRLYAPQS